MLPILTVNTILFVNGQIQIRQIDNNKVQIITGYQNITLVYQCTLKMKSLM